jgi:hypothetical protein
MRRSLASVLLAIVGLAMIGLAAVTGSVQAGERRSDPPGAAACASAAGDYLTGMVIRGPWFAGGRRQAGVELSHTRLTVQAEQDGRLYDVAIDNVFAEGFDPARRVIPAPLTTIRTGDRLELCGRFYTGGDVGIHWVHDNCGRRPTRQNPAGWIKKIAPDGAVGANLDGSQRYCPLWSAPAAAR